MEEGKLSRLQMATVAALRAIHRVGIVHRDLETPNITLDPRGNVRLMDFGIAKSLEVDTSTGATATGQIVGTPEYMSPETGQRQADRRQ
jgi:serine/threonine protein kinase